MGSEFILSIIGATHGKLVLIASNEVKRSEGLDILESLPNNVANTSVELIYGWYPKSSGATKVPSGLTLGILLIIFLVLCLNLVIAATVDWSICHPSCFTVSSSFIKSSTWSCTFISASTICLALNVTPSSVDISLRTSRVNCPNIGLPSASNVSNSSNIRSTASLLSGVVYTGSEPWTAS